MAKGKFVDITEDKILGEVLVADGLIAAPVEDVLWSAALVQRGKER